MQIPKGQNWGPASDKVLPGQQKMSTRDSHQSMSQERMQNMKPASKILSILYNFTPPPPKKTPQEL